MNSKQLFLATSLVTALIASSPALADYEQYYNQDTGTSIAFPTSMFEWEEELQDQQSGKTFSSNDGGSLTVFSYQSDQTITPKMIAQSIRNNVDDHFNITYERITNNWMVQSGYQNNLIYYQRIEFAPSGRVHGMLLKYPKSLRAKYDHQIGKIARSLNGT